MRSTADTGWDVVYVHVPATVYVGESPDDLSTYAAPGWDAWLAMWSLIGANGSAASNATQAEYLRGVANRLEQTLEAVRAEIARLEWTGVES